MKKNITISLFLFLFGAVGYCLIEVMARGYTHWTMGVAGGVCFIILINISKYVPWHGIIRKSLVGAGAITLIELSIGLIVNIWLNLDIWTYAAQPFNFMGQICAEYSFYWFLLCLPIMGVLEIPRLIRKIRIKRGT